ncbi:MAG: D-glycero-alpha-D-manno-heptose-1,7-bisphosphate 7-phosphatase [Chloroflexota bacterium]
MDAVFLDRDGVINENRIDHVKSWAEFRFLPGAREAIARITGAGIKVFIITNQAVVNRGLVSRETVDAINARMVEEVSRYGGRIEAVAYCPHREEEQCDCRKPRPGLLLDLARKYELRLSKTVLIGDALSDIDAGQTAGCQTILVLTGRGRAQLATALANGKNGFRVAPSLLLATEILLRPMSSLPVLVPAQPTPLISTAVA